MWLGPLSLKAAGVTGAMERPYLINLFHERSTLPSRLSLSGFSSFPAHAVNIILFQLRYWPDYLLTHLECKSHEDRHLVGFCSQLHPQHQEQRLAQSRGIIYIVWTKG